VKELALFLHFIDYSQDFLLDPLVASCWCKPDNPQQTANLNCQRFSGEFFERPQNQFLSKISPPTIGTGVKQFK